MAGKQQYSEEEVVQFIKTAQLMGLSPAIKRLKYPTFPTAQKWFRERGIELPNIDSLMQKAAELRVFYGDNEKKYALQVAMEAIVEKIQNDDLDADGLNKAANALAKLIQTFQLVEGKATQVTEKHEKDSTDLAITKLVEDMRKKNESIESNLG